MTLVTYHEFKKAVESFFEIHKKDQYDNSEAKIPYGLSPEQLRLKYGYFIRGLQSKGGVTCKSEAAMLLAHLIHESGGFRHKEEIAFIGSSGPNVYSPKEDSYGNKSYHGRGYIQLSHWYNYKEASKDLYGDENYLWKKPELVLEEKVAWDTAFWFWKKNVHNEPGVAEGRFEVTTHKINGGLEPPDSDLAKKRIQIYGLVCAALNLPRAKL